MLHQYLSTCSRYPCKRGAKLTDKNSDCHKWSFNLWPQFSPLLYLSVYVTLNTDMDIEQKLRASFWQFSNTRETYLFKRFQFSNLANIIRISKNLEGLEKYIDFIAGVFKWKKAYIIVWPNKHNKAKHFSLLPVPFTGPLTLSWLHCSNQFLKKSYQIPAILKEWDIF